MLNMSCAVFFHLNSCLQVHDFLKPEHLPAVFKICRISCFRIPGIRMEAVEKLYDVKSAFINIEMDVPFLKEEVPIHENCANGFKSER